MSGMAGKFWVASGVGKLPAWASTACLATRCRLSLTIWMPLKAVELGAPTEVELDELALELEVLLLLELLLELLTELLIELELLLDATLDVDLEEDAGDDEVLDEFAKLEFKTLLELPAVLLATPPEETATKLVCELVTPVGDEEPPDFEPPQAVREKIIKNRQG
jgi:hypothetical protein